jgi:uncharacterized protein DUF5060
MRTLIILLLIALPSFSAEVGLWDRFELSIENSKSYGDPYRDVSLDVTYTAPDGRTVNFWGFYDSGSTWQIRFMPDALGQWKYEAKFSDGSPGATGSFQCVRSDLPGLISTYEANPRWFGYKQGDPELIRSLHIGDRFFAANWPDDKREAFLDWTQSQGYNMLSIASHYLNRELPGRGGGWVTPDLWPIDAAEYRKMERHLDDLEDRRILVYPFAGFYGKNSDYPRDPADQLAYARYTIARLGPYWNLLFNVAGPEPNLKKSWMDPADVARLGKLIKRLDVFGHMLSVHNRTGDDPYVSSSWTTYSILQGPKTVDRKRLSLGLIRNLHGAKPLYAQETLWAGNKYHKEPYTNTDLRKNTYVLTMSAAMINFGDMNGDSSSGFSGGMDLGERFQERHDILRKVWDFFETVPFHEMAPRQDLVDNGYCLAAPARQYLVYLERPGTVNVAAVREHIEYEVTWINAQDTRDRRPGGTTSDGHGLSSPTTGDDWLVHLVAKPAAQHE